ncbi:MAG: carbohydrate ABC transporter permease [Chloroflexota bacterium]
MTEPTIGREPFRQRFGTTLYYLLLLAGAAVMLVPFLWMVSTSLKANEYVLTMPPQFIPQPATLDSYRRLFDLFPMGRMFVNSLIVALAVTLGQLVTCSMAAYAFARMQFRGRDALFLLYLATLMIPFQVTITPLFILMSTLGWVNTYQGLILPGVFSAFGTFLLRQAFLTIPADYEESAVLDGANPFTIFTRIIMPLATPCTGYAGRVRIHEFVERLPMAVIYRTRRATNDTARRFGNATRPLADRMEPGHGRHCDHRYPHGPGLPVRPEISRPRFCHQRSKGLDAVTGREEAPYSRQAMKSSRNPVGKTF